MPKTKLAPRPADDVPTWDALLVELGDPRPYTPLEVPPSYVVPDGYFAPITREYDEAWAELDRQVDDLLTDLDDVARDAWAAFDEVYPWSEQSAPPRLRVVDDATILVPIVGTLDATEESSPWQS